MVAEVVAADSPEWVAVAAAAFQEWGEAVEEAVVSQVSIICPASAVVVEVAAEAASQEWVAEVAAAFPEWVEAVCQEWVAEEVEAGVFQDSTIYQDSAVVAEVAVEAASQEWVAAVAECPEWAEVAAVAFPEWVEAVYPEWAVAEEAAAEAAASLDSVVSQVRLMTMDYLAIHFATP